MTTSYTISGSYSKQGNGDNSGTWGDVANTNFDLIDQNINGWITKATADANVTLTSTSGASNEARNIAIKFTGALTANRDITVPAVTKVYIIDNACTGSFSLVVKTALGTGVTVPNGSKMLVYCDGTNVVSGPQALPIGSVQAFAGSAAPPLWLLMYGQAVSRTTYADLFAVIGTTYGVGNGTTTFNLPDVRGRVVAGKDNMGGSTAARLTSAAGGVDGVTLGAAGGTETHTLTTAQLAAHSHTITDPGHTHSVTDPGHTHSPSALLANDGSGIPLTTAGAGTPVNYGASISSASTGISVASATTGITTANAGSGSAHPNTQPTLIFNYIIYAGA